MRSASAFITLFGLISLTYGAIYTMTGITLHGSGTLTLTPRSLSTLTSSSTLNATVTYTHDSSPIVVTSVWTIFQTWITTTTSTPNNDMYTFEVIGSAEGSLPSFHVTCTGTAQSSKYPLPLSPCSMSGTPNPYFEAYVEPPDTNSNYAVSVQYGSASLHFTTVGTMQNFYIDGSVTHLTSASSLNTFTAWSTAKTIISDGMESDAVLLSMEPSARSPNIMGTAIGAPVAVSS